MKAINPHSRIIEKFTLYGVHGYKDLSVEFFAGATVIAAQNGAGKTTLLGALNAFLNRRFHRLASFSFTKLECKFYDRPMVFINKENLPGTTNEASAKLNAYAEEAGISADEFMDFLHSEYMPSKAINSYRTHPVVRSLFINTAHDYDGIKRILDSLYKLQDTSLSKSALQVRNIVHEVMSGISVVYLPTYRRVELPLLRSSRAKNRPGYRSPTDIQGPILVDMAFGLSDVEQKLKDLFDEIERDSNIEYRSLSAKMLEDMLRPAHAQQSLNLLEELPDVDQLSRFLTRLGREDNLRHIFKDIEELYRDGRIYNTEYANLKYFLHRLNAVIARTRIKEQRIESFVAVCNGFLIMSGDEKELTFDPATLRVVVKNRWIKDGIVPFDALSSGEKQIISLMAKLYLYDGNKIILIDEPELSLSIPWQKRVLPDMLNSGAVAQLLAITHSPFIFDNELESNATELKIRYFEGDANE